VRFSYWANFGKKGRPKSVIPKISFEALAQMVGTTISRVRLFMRKFRKLGFIDYNGELKINNSLLNVVLRDQFLPLAGDPLASLVPQPTPGRRVKLKMLDLFCRLPAGRRVQLARS
jgi:hypothetical protein